MTLKNTDGNYWRFRGLTHEHLTHVVMSVGDFSFRPPVQRIQEVGLLLSSQPWLRMRSKARKRGRLIHIGHLNRILSPLKAQNVLHTSPGTIFQHCLAQRVCLCISVSFSEQKAT